ncbi:MAG: peroxiredoxin [Candidatus Binataceae bacterium]
MPASTEELRDGVFAASELELLNQRGEPAKLTDFRGRNLVVYFYPMDDTPGCTTEGQEFRDLYDQFQALDTAVVGVSVDSVQSHREFAEKHGFPFMLLSDQRGELARAFGVLRDGIADRATFVFDRDGHIRRVFHEVRAHGHAQQVLNFVRTLLESHRMIGG